MTPALPLLVLLAAPADGDWRDDFASQPIAARPRLEVRYTDASRSAFEVEAESYHVLGELRAPHRLVDASSGEPWLTFELEAADGAVYSSSRNPEPSRINLYRRGPYYCEVHWLDVRVADQGGVLAPLRGDLALHCYPDRMLASITWRATAAFAARAVRIRGASSREYETESLAAGAARRFAFALRDDVPPLSPESLETLEAVRPLTRDARRGCYTIGSRVDGRFEEHFYHHPNRHESVRFRVRNDATPRTIWICHETSQGAKGCVEGGVLLDAEGHPLPVLVQISKNFSGEREEKFYNPLDAAFSETWFPLRLAPHEVVTVTSLHLFQNWGRHMVKQFSSLGAWMDYFHSSTGVTETTCYVPFKYGGLPGVAIADLRAMSQPTFWRGQPQHDNIAGHSFLSYRTAETWNHLVYRGTTYHSTGPNWMDIELEYVSSDGAVAATVRTFELPQADELRNFLRVRYEVRRPLSIRAAPENFRLLTIASWVQRLRYRRFAATGAADRRLDFSREGFPVRRVSLPRRNSFAALLGERKGSNAIVIRDWQCSRQSSAFGPAASVLCEPSGDTRLLIVPDAENLTLLAGDVIELEGFFLPYGEVGSAATPRREAIAYGEQAPGIVGVTRGTRLRDFPATVRAEGNGAELELRGGRDLIPVIVTGLTDYRWPRISVQESGGWRPLRHSRVSALDGVQVFSEDLGRFGAVFLVPSNHMSQRLRISVGEEAPSAPRVRIRAGGEEGGAESLRVAVRAPWMGGEIQLSLPETLRTDRPEIGEGTATDSPSRLKIPAATMLWRQSEADSLWYEIAGDRILVGGRLTPNEDDLDVELWLENRTAGPLAVATRISIDLAGTVLADGSGERSWIHDGQAWRPAAEAERSKEGGGGAAPLVAVESADGERTLGLVWAASAEVAVDPATARVLCEPAWPRCPPRRRAHLRGKLYLVEGNLDDLLLRARRDLPY